MSSSFEIQLSVANLFRIGAFRCSAHEMIDDGSTFSLVLESGDAPIYVKRYPLKQLHEGSALLLAELEIEAKRFVDEGMTPVLKMSPSYSLESGTVGVLDYQQAVALAGKNQWWIARLAGKPHHMFYYLLHWVGEQAHAEKVVSAMASFELIEPVMSQRR
jgi:hypothetical protein